VVDFNRFYEFKDNLSNAYDIIWFVEEFYAYSSAEDVTQSLLVPQGYAASYNVPYNKTLNSVANLTTNYTDDPRYTLFKKYAPGIQDYEGFRYVMRLNNFSDTGDHCQAIASRCDLANGTISGLPWGALDCKTTSSAGIADHIAVIQDGPTYQ